MNYYSSIDYSGVPGEAIFINSNLILTEPVLSWRKTEVRRGRTRGDSAQNSGYLRERPSQEEVD